MVKIAPQLLDYLISESVHRYNSSPHSHPNPPHPGDDQTVVVWAVEEGDWPKSEPCDVPARRKTHFKPGKELKSALHQQ